MARSAVFAHEKNPTRRWGFLLGAEGMEPRSSREMGAGMCGEAAGERCGLEARR
jgi:hypothetical protein